MPKLRSSKIKKPLESDKPKIKNSSKVKKKKSDLRVHHNLRPIVVLERIPLPVIEPQPVVEVVKNKKTNGHLDPPGADGAAASGSGHRLETPAPSPSPSLRSPPTPAQLLRPRNLKLRKLILQQRRPSFIKKLSCMKLRSRVLARPWDTEKLLHKKSKPRKRKASLRRSPSPSPSPSPSTPRRSLSESSVDDNRPLKYFAKKMRRDKSSSGPRRYESSPDEVASRRPSRSNTRPGKPALVGSASAGRSTPGPARGRPRARRGKKMPPDGAGTPRRPQLRTRKQDASRRRWVARQDSPAVDQRQDTDHHTNAYRSDPYDEPLHGDSLAQSEPESMEPESVQAFEQWIQNSSLVQSEFKIPEPPRRRDGRRPVAERDLLRRCPARQFAVGSDMSRISPQVLSQCCGLCSRCKIIHRLLQKARQANETETNPQTDPPEEDDDSTVAIESPATIVTSDPPPPLILETRSEWATAVAALDAEQNADTFLPIVVHVETQAKDESQLNPELDPVEVYVFDSDEENADVQPLPYKALKMAHPNFMNVDTINIELRGNAPPGPRYYIDEMPGDHVIRATKTRDRLGRKTLHACLVTRDKYKIIDLSLPENEVLITQLMHSLKEMKSRADAERNPRQSVVDNTNYSIKVPMTNDGPPRAQNSPEVELLRPIIAMTNSPAPTEVAQPIVPVEESEGSDKFEPCLLWEEDEKEWGSDNKWDIAVPCEVPSFEECLEEAEAEAEVEVEAITDPTPPSCETPEQPPAALQLRDCVVLMQPSAEIDMQVSAMSEPQPEPQLEQQPELQREHLSEARTFTILEPQQSCSSSSPAEGNTMASEPQPQPHLQLDSEPSKASNSAKRSKGKRPQTRSSGDPNSPNPSAKSSKGKKTTGKKQPPRAKSPEPQPSTSGYPTTGGKKSGTRPPPSQEFEPQPSCSWHTDDLRPPNARPPPRRNLRYKGKRRDRPLCSKIAMENVPMADILEAPVFYPDPEDMLDLNAYFAKIQPMASKFGICRIVSPTQFAPDCNTKDKDVQFKCNVQYISSLFMRWGPTAREIAAIKGHMATMKMPFVRAPLFEGIEVDLVKLFHVVDRYGRFEKVQDWGLIAQEMHLNSGRIKAGPRLEKMYCKHLLPYEAMRHAEREELLHKIDVMWHMRYRNMLGRSDMPLQRQQVLLGELDSSSDESESEMDQAINAAFSEIEDCVVTGPNMNLGKFKKVAQHLLDKHFGGEQPSTPVAEREYWRLVQLGTEHVCVNIASVDTSIHGLGFPSDPQAQHGNHPWNLKRLGENRHNVLSSLGPTLSVTVPTLHLGMLFSTNCWHMDPHHLPWAEFMHSGPTKVWYGIPSDQSENFRKAVEKLCPTAVQNKSIWLPSDILMIPPELLRQHGVTLSRLCQEPGEFVVVFPKAYSCSVSTGLTVSESLYFASEEWLSDVGSVFEELRRNCEPAMFPIEQLLVGVARDSRASLSALRAADAVLRPLLLAEQRRRRQARADGFLLLTPEEYVQRNRLHSLSPWQVMRDECDVCRSMAYFSKVIGLTPPRSSLCLDHGLSVDKTGKGPRRERTCIIFVSDAELEEILALLSARIR